MITLLSRSDVLDSIILRLVSDLGMTHMPRRRILQERINRSQSHFAALQLCPTERLPRRDLVLVPSFSMAEAFNREAVKLYRFLHRHRPNDFLMICKAGVAPENATPDQKK